MDDFCPRLCYDIRSRSFSHARKEDNFCRDYFAVAKGWKPGIYRTWTECNRQVIDFEGAMYQKFESKLAALKYLKDNQISLPSRSIDRANNSKKKCTDVSTKLPSTSSNHQSTIISKEIERCEFKTNIFNKSYVVCDEDYPEIDNISVIIPKSSAQNVDNDLEMKTNVTKKKEYKISDDNRHKKQTVKAVPLADMKHNDQSPPFLCSTPLIRTNRDKNEICTVGNDVNQASIMKEDNFQNSEENLIKNMTEHSPSDKIFIDWSPVECRSPLSTAETAVNQHLIARKILSEPNQVSNLTEQLSDLHKSLDDSNKNWEYIAKKLDTQECTIDTLEHLDNRWIEIKSRLECIETTLNSLVRNKFHESRNVTPSPEHCEARFSPMGMHNYSSPCSNQSSGSSILELNTSPVTESENSFKIISKNDSCYPNISQSRKNCAECPRKIRALPN